MALNTKDPELGIAEAEPLKGTDFGATDVEVVSR
jgi:hypothetical protein